MNLRKGFHRHCTLHGTVPVEGIRISTLHEDHPTGIGVGKMYISSDRKSYRNSYKSVNVCSEKALRDCTNYLQEVVNGEKIAFIGRPSHCIP